MATIDSLKKTLSCLKGHRRRYEKRYEDVLKYSDVARTEKLKTLVVEQNDKVIAHLEKMLDVVEENKSMLILLLKWKMQKVLKSK